MSNKLLNSFASTSLAKLYLQSDSTDIHFVFPSMDLAPTVKVPAHKLLLATASPVFKAMFNGSWNENETVDIIDSNAEAFKEFLQFIYLPEVTLTIGNIEEVVRLADKYDMLDCFETCAEFLEANLTTENVVWGYQLAIVLNNTQLMESCEEHIQIHVEEIVRSEMFLQCSRDVIDHILKLDTLGCEEIELFHACIEWAKVSCQKNGLDESNSKNLKSQLGSCFYLIRFGAMDGEEFDNILQSKVIKGMFTSDELADIMRSKSSKQYESELFDHQPRLKPSYEWNTDNKMVCNRIKRNSQLKYNVQQQESTWFSTNEHILLGEILFNNIYFGLSKTVSINFDIEIIEYDGENFKADAPAKQLYTSSNNESSCALLLSQPIIVRPKKLYEIRMLPKSGVLSCWFTSPWENCEVKINQKITVEFHPDPLLESYLQHRGLVSALYFNRVE